MNCIKARELISKTCTRCSRHFGVYSEDVNIQHICPKCWNELRAKEEENKMPKEAVPMAEDIRDYNIGESDYSKHKIQPWDIWIEYKLNPFDADIVKRVLRHKKTDSRKMDYEKIIHICKERIRQIDSGEDKWEEK